MAVVLAAAASSVVSPASAGVLRPAEIRSRLKDVRAALTRVADRLDKAEVALEEASVRAARHDRALRQATTKVTLIRAALSRRSAQLYMLGGTSDLEALLSADDPTNFADRVAYLDQVRQGERGLIEDLRILKLRGKTERIEFRNALAHARSARNVLAGHRRELDQKLREYQMLLRFLEMAGGRTVYRASRHGPRGFVCPVAGGSGVSNDFGAPRRGGPHTGNDIHADYGQRTVAVLPATVVDLPTGGWIGIGIIIRDPAGNEWWYAHLSSRNVSVGEHVVPGEAIGRVGCSGHCYGPHLHFEYHPGGGAPRDPYPILRQAC
jgi:murein DD-endopeptidase MepM/ murein hydrolase activator NlpD